MVELADIAIVAKEFAVAFLGHGGDGEKLCTALSARTGAQIVGITDGIRGSWIASRNQSIHQPAIPAAATVDTTGCGDVYHGAFLSALLQDASPFEAALAASRAASMTASALGGRSGLDPRAR